MSGYIKQKIRKVRNHPVIVMAAVAAPVLVAIANAGGVIGEMKHLWASWMKELPHLETTWQGAWKGDDGYKFDFAMRVEIFENDSVEGYIRWRLVEAPQNSPVAHRINHRATECVSGRYNRKERIVTLTGYKVSDPGLISKDEYRFQVLPDKATFVAMTKNVTGNWEAAAEGRVIIVEKALVGGPLNDEGERRDQIQASSVRAGKNEDDCRR